MKIKSVITILLLAIILVSCAPAVTTIPPTETAIPSSTFAPVPPTFTVVPTPTPENIADAKDLPKWIDDFVHAYGEKILINGVELDASQLTDEIRKNGESFIQTKKVHGIQYSFLLVNDIPLAKMGTENKWQAVGLKDLINDGFEIGVGLTSDLQSQTEYWNILNSNFNQTTVESGFHWKWLEPENGKYDNYQLSLISEQIKNSSSQNPLSVLRGHPISFAANNPEWLLKLSEDEATQVLQHHVSDIVKKFPQIQEWVVVNEPYLSTPQYNYTRPDALYQIIGADYISIAFKAAREANPQAKLIYNDTLNHSLSSGINSMTTTLTNENIMPLIQQGLIDGVGMQMHIDSSRPPSTDDVIKAMDSYGVPIYITELDVDISGLTGSDKEKGTIQADLFANVLEACLSAKQCVSFTFWNIGDKYSWLELYMNKPNANATPFDDELKPKSAYYAMLQVLYKHVP
jgi:endo-1,4-beta-xylanase